MADDLLLVFCPMLDYRFYMARPIADRRKDLNTYVHKVAIGNSRIKAIDSKSVTFSWFDYRTSKGREMTLAGQEFVRRSGYCSADRKCCRWITFTWFLLYRIC
jgi:hypothetical protein